MHLNAGFFSNSKQLPNDFHYVRTDVILKNLKFLDTDGRPDGIATSSKRKLLTNEHLVA